MKDPDFDRFIFTTLQSALITGVREGLFRCLSNLEFGGAGFVVASNVEALANVLDKALLPSLHRLSVSVYELPGLMNEEIESRWDPTSLQSVQRLLDALQDCNKRPPLKKVHLSWCEAFGSVKNARLLGSAPFPLFEDADLRLWGEAASAFLTALAGNADGGTAAGGEQKKGGGGDRFESLSLVLGPFERRLKTPLNIVSLLPGASLRTLKFLLLNNLYRHTGEADGVIGGALGQMVREGHLLNLTYIMIESCWFSREDMRLLMEAVAESEKGMPRLDLFRVFCTEAKVKAGIGLTFLASALGRGKLPALEKINLQVVGIDDGDMAAFGDLVRTNDLPSLTEIDFTDNMKITQFVENLSLGVAAREWKDLVKAAGKVEGEELDPALYPRAQSRVRRAYLLMAEDKSLEEVYGEQILVDLIHLLAEKGLVPKNMKVELWKRTGASAGTGGTTELAVGPYLSLLLAAGSVEGLRVAIEGERVTTKPPLSGGFLWVHKDSDRGFLSGERLIDQAQRSGMK
uniref:Uncharacterized protein n=1 Tax=Chromera velia CCMP2878 TaxID=1169474 RepID=A0A0G4GUD6_9ALVE|eukprot:Cvel_23414.t1-p1 / transcript=Cvel_23414.t1 / gene=Cvel_23414 / organism=Chromera_velia_CCMP2878 / gene_product=hypothetical protein / transcript_product=hypothetical protein / location=Cvel_scaffold2410:19946-28685(+) / protein_length=516 / sequence_SO=supercontig / SO=protein_coding / is_pseudo=false